MIQYFTYIEFYYYFNIYLYNNSLTIFNILLPKADYALVFYVTERKT